ncbi:MAG: hypothetical protein U0V75_12745 [Ferruginibacter sp.]
MKKYTALLLLQVFVLAGYSQVYLEPFTGFQFDMNNTSPHFKQVNTGLSCSFKSRGSYELVLQLNHSLPLAVTSSDSAFTTNLSLPLYAAAKEKINPSSTSFALVHRIAITGKKSVNTLYATISIGVVYQELRVSYAYDKANYSILNPDKTQNRSNIYGGVGLLFIHQLKKNRLFAEIAFNTPPAGPKIKYPSSFKFMAPAALNLGYSFTIKNKRNASS